MFLAVWEMRMALCLGLSTWVSMSCLCVVRWMALTSFLGGVMCAKRCAQRSEEEGGCVPLACKCGLEVV